MTLTNREVLAVDPTERDIPNLGVAKVKQPEDDGDWKTLAWELESFVCEGAYDQGLERILSQYLTHLGQAEQPAVWVSGFYGSGKSHLMRVLEYLWRDLTLPTGASARSLTTLSTDIDAHLVELTNRAKQAGGLWSAAGTLGAGSAESVRLAFLGVLFKAAGLPENYGPARLAIRLHQEQLFDQVRASVESAGKNLETELRNLYVSTPLHQALIDTGAGFGATPVEVKETLLAQYPLSADPTVDETLDVLDEVLKLQSSKDGKRPLTLIVLDEMQQFINEDNKTAEHVQFIVEGISSRFDSQVLVVATGQSALTATPTLQKLTDRFSVQVALSDTDVETVVRKVVLRKKPDKIADIESVLGKAAGEISRQLGGTKIEAKSEDKDFLNSDYPLLPTRRRFWERILKAVDPSGKGGVLRTQLKIVHEAARQVAGAPLGTVIGGDFVFRSESTKLLQSGVLLKELDELIRSLQDGSEDGELKSRAASLVFLIAQLPSDEGFGDIGVRATEEFLADLLVEDLDQDGARLRKDVPRVLGELVEDGKVVKIGDEYSLQTAEGAEWTNDFNKRRAQIKGDPTRMSSLRHEWLLRVVDDALGGINLRQGSSSTARKLQRYWNDEAPPPDKSIVPVWIQDEWSSTEAKIKGEAVAAGPESPVVFVLLPKLAGPAIDDALATYAAAKDTVGQRPEPQTPEGRTAKDGMRSRAIGGEHQLTKLFDEVVTKARVFQGGGNELTTTALRSGVEAAATNSLTRMFPKFTIADHKDWDKVGDKARDGDPAAIKSVSWTEEAVAHPVCKEALARIPGGGAKGSDLQSDLTQAPYGWPRNAIESALLVLLAGGHVRAEKDGQAVDAKALPPTQIGKATFYKEDPPPTVDERLKVRGLLKSAGVAYTANQESVAISGLIQHFKALALQAGGPAPLPVPPDTAHVGQLALLAGNQQLRVVAEQHDQLQADLVAWKALADQRAGREASWTKLDRLLNHAADLPIATEIAVERDAILDGRLLLTSPDPVGPLVTKAADALRAAVVDASASLKAEHAEVLRDLSGYSEWQELEQTNRDALIAAHGLVATADPDVASDEALLATLDATSLQGWLERRQALPVKLQQAREAAAKKLQPKAVTVKAPGATLTSEAQVETYVTALRTTLLGHVTNGETVII